VVGVEQWAEVRRLFFVRGLSQREIHRRTGLHRDTIRNAEPGWVDGDLEAGTICPGGSRGSVDARSEEVSA
jgi:hypothetical protein